MNLKEQHWQQLFGHQTQIAESWYSISTAYAPDRSVVRESKFVRTFHCAEDGSNIIHTNRYYNEDGSYRERSWTIDKTQCNLDDGVIHPAAEGMRSLSCDRGVTAWICPALNRNQFNAELFIPHDDRRYSAVIIYSYSGWLETIYLIREQLGTFPDRLVGEPISSLSDRWRLTRTQMTPRLEVSTQAIAISEIVDPTAGETAGLFFPDGIVIHAPDSIELGQEFEVSLGQLVSENQFDRVTVSYDRTGHFQALRKEVFERGSRPIAV